MLTLHLTPKDDIETVLNGINTSAEVYLTEGVYSNKLWIKSDNITLIGAGAGKTVITFGDYANKIHADGREYNTFRTYSLCITGENVTLKNLTVENSSTDPAVNGQCVALSVNAKRFRAEGIELKSTQDTLFLAPFPDDLTIRYDGFIPKQQLYMEGTSLHLFENCRIQGTVDFIFGCAEAYFRNCEIISVKDSRDIGFIAAPAHSLKQERGFYFIDCDIASDGASEGKVYLARPWRDFGKCVFINCRLGKHIHPALFDKWNDTERDKTARFSYYGLKGEHLRPAVWSSPLTDDEATTIISIYTRHINGNFR